MNRCCRAGLASIAAVMVANVVRRASCRVATLILHAILGGVAIGVPNEQLFLLTNRLQLLRRFQARSAALGLGSLEKGELLIQALDLAVRPA